ncbi:hypothetical protein [Allomesorhizobium camelthorni]|uniref:Uncharacterized protein n=1 Tax=Allomesorhizobium camelthorni TaxID=475069 RepID=A0A6G4WJN1_9HYPH|nr:hypothetical protein [Mesorhizobium camelthorni]NGO54824.1 hypothetical protein [Mesorhizobium camelthorni]
MSGTEARLPTAAESAFQAMTGEQRRDHIDRLEYASVKADQANKAAALKAQVDAATQVSLDGNAWFQAQQRGQLNQRITVANGQTTVEQLNAKAPMNSGPFISAPAAIVDQLPVTVGGIQLGPQQAKDMLARGEISKADYDRGLNEALIPYGYGKPIASFR